MRQNMNEILLLLCNNKVIEFLLSFNTDLNRFYFLSDGCGNQFHSQFVFRSLCYYPPALKLSWDYGEAMV